jgi:hypothetical protein
MLDLALDINASGIIAGSTDDRPALLLAENSVVYLEDVTLSGYVLAINNADQLGDFQAVGYTESPGLDFTPTFWNVNVDGRVRSSKPLVDIGGSPFYVSDISDSGLMGGRVILKNESIPAIAMFTEVGLLASLRPNPNPADITSIGDAQVSDDGDLLGDGYEYVGPAGHSRAVIWPTSGGVVDLSAETGYTSTQGNGIATVSGAMQAVGRAEKDGRGAFAYLFADGTFSNLETMSLGDQPWKLDRAEGINSAGMICGVGTIGNKRNRQVHGFLLIPTFDE